MCFRMHENKFRFAGFGLDLGDQIGFAADAFGHIGKQFLVQK